MSLEDDARVSLAAADREAWLTIEEFSVSRNISVNAIRNVLRTGRFRFATRFVNGVFLICPTREERPRLTPPPFYQGLYFIECEAFIKIGYSDDVRKRLLTLKHANPFPVRPLGFIWRESLQAMRDVEAHWHTRFSAVRHRGEWFRAVPVLRDAITMEASLWPTPKAKRTA